MAIFVYGNLLGKGLVKFGWFIKYKNFFIIFDKFIYEW